MSDWIIDVPATIENEGSRHIECTDCGTVLKIEEIPQLTDKDNSDEDGYSKVGDYSILITDKDSKPVFNSEISIDKDDNITIKLPEGRLLDYEDRTTITVVRTDTKAAAATPQQVRRTQAVSLLFRIIRAQRVMKTALSAAITAKQNILMLLPLQTKTIPSFPIVKFT